MHTNAEQIGKLVIESVSNRLKKYLEDTGMTQAQLASQLRMSQPQVSDIMTGKSTQMTAATLFRIAEFLGETTDQVGRYGRDPDDRYFIERGVKDLDEDIAAIGEELDDLTKRLDGVVAKLDDLVAKLNDLTVRVDHLERLAVPERKPSPATGQRARWR
jgi:transcriptional regulator with XRE-family HTH domain